MFVSVEEVIVSVEETLVGNNVLEETFPVDAVAVIE